MDRNVLEERASANQARGTTLMELLSAISILLVIAAIAMPSLAQMRKNLEARRVARHVVQLLREARSTAIAMNTECRVEFETPARRFGLRRGDRAADTDWSAVPPVSDWIECPPDVNLSANVKSVQFNTNGTANGGTITVRDLYNEKKFAVIVARTGRIRIR